MEFCPLVSKEKIAIAILNMSREFLKTHPTGRFSPRGAVLCLSNQAIKLSNLHQRTHLLVHINVPQIAKLVTQSD
jgi:hypothetical protein